MPCGRWRSISASLRTSIAYQDKYDSYGEYEDYDEEADRPEAARRAGCARGRDDYVGYQPADWRTEHASADDRSRAYHDTASSHLQ